MGQLRVIADTSFLMIPSMFGVDIISELNRLLNRRYKLIIPKPVVKELEHLSVRGTPSERSAARIGLVLVERGEVVPSRSSADDSILKLAEKGNCVVGTTDMLLQRKLKERGVIVVRLRQRSHLMLTRDLE